MIRRVRIENWRGIESLEWSPPPVSIVVGSNGAGKSSIRAAVEWALTGRVTGWTDDAGRGAEALIRAGAKKAVVELELEGVGTVRRTIHASSTPTRLEVEGLSGGIQVVQEALLGRIGASADVVSAALSVGRFLSMAPKEQQDLLFRLSGLTFDGAAVREALGPGPWTGQDAILTDLGLDALSGGPEAFDELDKRAREARRLAKKELEEANRALAALPAPPPGADPASEGAARELLAQLRSERDALMARVGEANLARSLLGQAGARRERLLQELEGLGSAKPPKPPKRPSAAVERELEGARREAFEAAEARASASVALAHAEEDLSSLAGLGSAEASEGRCPFAPVAVPCASSAEALSSLDRARADLERRRAQAEAALEKADRRLEAARGKVAALEAELKAAREAEAAVERHAGLEERIRAALSEAEGEMERHGPKARALDEIQASIRTLEERIARGETLLRQMEEARRAEEARKKAIERCDRADAAVVALEALVARIPEAKDRILAEALQPLAERVNWSLSLLGPLELRFSLRDGFRVECRVPAGGDAWVPPVLLSAGERLRVAAALADGLCQLAGFPLLVIDDANALDPYGKSVLVAWLREVAQDYVDVLVLATTGDVRPVDPGIEGFGVFVVAGGRIERAPVAAREGAA